MITSHLANPFVLLMNPDAVFRAIEASEHLQGLGRRVFRPLDEPRVGGDSCEEDTSFDAWIEEGSEGDDACG